MGAARWTTPSLGLRSVVTGTSQLPALFEPNPTLLRPPLPSQCPTEIRYVILPNSVPSPHSVTVMFKLGCEVAFENNMEYTGVIDISLNAQGRRTFPSVAQRSLHVWSGQSVFHSNRNITATSCFSVWCRLRLKWDGHTRRNQISSFGETD